MYGLFALPSTETLIRAGANSGVTHTHAEDELRMLLKIATLMTMPTSSERLPALARSLRASAPPLKRGPFPASAWDLAKVDRRGSHRGPFDHLVTARKIHSKGAKLKKPVDFVSLRTEERTILRRLRPFGVSVPPSSEQILLNLY